MEKFYNKFNSFFGVLPGGFYGLLSVIIGLTGDFIAMLLYPGYNLIDNEISDLGTGPGGLFFNVGVILAGILAIPYIIALGKVLLNESENDRLLNDAIKLAIMSCVALSLIGVFPAYIDNLPSLILHGIFAAISFFCGGGYLLIFGYYILKTEVISNFFAYYGFITAALFGLFLVTWLPIIEWIGNIGIISWTTLMALYLLVKRI
jgi:hypothetical membrane protein